MLERFQLMINGPPRIWLRPHPHPYLRRRLLVGPPKFPEPTPVKVATDAKPRLPAEMREDPPSPGAERRERLLQHRQEQQALDKARKLARLDVPQMPGRWPTLREKRRLPPVETILECLQWKLHKIKRKGGKVVRKGRKLARKMKVGWKGAAALATVAVGLAAAGASAQVPALVASAISLSH